MAALTGLGLLAVAGAALGAFHPTLWGHWEFLWDDTENFSDNMLERLHWSWDNFQWWCGTPILRVYEPVALALKASAASVLELNPGNLHLIAGLSHAFCASLAFFGSRHFLQGEEVDDLASVLCRALGAMTFAVHPLCTQVVCWSSCLPYIWSASLCWLSLILFRTDRSWRAAVLNVLSAAAFLAATLCKAAVLLWPVVLTILRSWNQRPHEGAEKGKKGKALLPFSPDMLHWLLALYSSSLAYSAAVDTSLEHQHSAVQLELLDNSLRAFTSLFLYLIRFLTPIHLHCLPFHPVEASPLTTQQRLTGALAAALVVALLLSRGRDWLLMYLALMAPCLQLLQHGDPVWFADRYAFVPMALLLPGCIACSLRWALWNRPLALALLVPPLLMAVALQSTRSCDCWRTGVQLWGFAAQELDWPSFHHQLGVSLLSAGHGNSSAAEASLLRAWSGRPEALTAKAMARLVEAQGGAPKKSLRWLRKALELAPSTGLSTSQLAATYHDMAVLESRLERPKIGRILELYNQSLQLAPDRSLTQEHLGLALAVAERHSEALLHLRRAQGLGRDTPELHNGLGAIFVAENRWRQAQEAFQRALELRPGWPDAAENLRIVQGHLQEKKAAKQKKREKRRQH